MRIAVLGPESSGKTTLCQDLQRELGATLVHEYARKFLQDKPNYELDDLLHIAQEQAFKNASATGDLVLCDTEMTVAVIWAQERFNQVPPMLESCELSQNFDLYLLCSPDMPWEPDPLRESPHDRHRLFELYRLRLEMLRRNYRVLHGDRRPRVSQVRRLLAIDS